jgi:hypothetical protein
LRAVALRETEGLLVKAKDAAETATRLAGRLGESGAISKLDQAREQVFYAEITAQLARARQSTASERERLARLMGLWGNDLDFKLPEYAAFIEYFGMAGKPQYDEGIKAKLAVYKRMEMDVIPIYPSTLKGDWQQHIMEELDAINLRRYHSLQFNKYWSRKDQGSYRNSQPDRDRHYGSNQLSLFKGGGYR